MAVTRSKHLHVLYKSVSFYSMLCICSNFAYINITDITVLSVIFLYTVYIA